MSNTEPKNNEGAKKKGGKIVLIICILIIIALIGVVIYLLMNKDSEEQTRRNVVVNEDNVEEIIEQMQNSRVADGYYEMTMNSTWYFEDGAAASENAYVENTVTNTNAVYFDIMRSDTEETIFESPIIPVGSHLEGITLDKILDAGTYDCVLIYHLMDEDYENEISTVRVSVTIVIEN